MIFCRPVLIALVVALASPILPHLVQAAELSASYAAMTSRIEGASGSHIGRALSLHCAKPEVFDPFEVASDDFWRRVDNVYRSRKIVNKMPLPVSKETNPFKLRLLGHGFAVPAGGG